MGVLIIFCIILFAIYKTHDLKDLEDWVLCIMLSSIATILVSLLILLPCMCFNKETGYKEDYRIPISSVMNKDGINGRFSLGTGHVNSSQYYYAMQDLGNNSYKPLNINSNLVDYIRESSETPSLVVYKNIRYNKIAHYFSGFTFEFEDYRYAFIVPKNTVIVQYKVN